MEYEIIPSILVDTFDEFSDRISQCEEFAQTVQWDLMDGQFVEDSTFSDIADLKQLDTVLSIEVHLMAEEPDEYFEDLAKAGVDRVIIHFESTDKIEDVIQKMNNYDFEKGLAINPETSLDDIPDIFDQLDQVLVMTVVPGEAGKSFMESELDKVKELRDLYPDLAIEVDGGINLQTIRMAKDAGANRFSVNTALFATPDPAQSFEMLKAML